jgi:hypothetical protein
VTGVLRPGRFDDAEKYHDDKQSARYSRVIHSPHEQTFNWEMARPGAAPRHVKKHTNHCYLWLRLLRVLHVFYIARVATAAALVLVRRSGVILHRVSLDVEDFSRPISPKVTAITSEIKVS